MLHNISFCSLIQAHNLKRLLFYTTPDKLLLHFPYKNRASKTDVEYLFLPPLHLIISKWEMIAIEILNI